MKALVKLGGQIGAAVFIYLTSDTTHFGTLFSYQLPEWLDGFMVVLWIVAVINAFNLIDGLDGLASGLAIISSVGLCGILIMGNLPGVILILVALVGACLAFLRYNFHPATIFLGDTGSMFIGFVLGVVSLQTFTKDTFFLALTIPLLVVGVPIYDALLAIWRRSVRKILSDNDPTPGAPRRGIMTPDVEHLHHRLLRAGLSTRKVAYVLYITNASLIGFGILMATFKSHAAGIFLLALLMAVFVLLRQLAVIELKETGRALLTGLRRPSNSMLKALWYPTWDMLCLAGSLCLAMFLFESDNPNFWQSWFFDLPIWVTPTMSLLALSRTYITVWTRARILDIMMLISTLLAGLLISTGIALIIDPLNAPRFLIRALMMAFVGNAGILSLRVVYRCVEEMVLYLKSKSDAAIATERVLLYGAGGRSQLYLKERGFNNSSSYDNRVILGMIDDDALLHGKWVYGYSVMGGLGDVPMLKEKHKVTSIIITATLRPESMEAVQSLTASLGLGLSEWRFENRVLRSIEPASAENQLSSSGLTHKL